MKSIRSQLIVGLMASVVLLELAAGAGLFSYVEEALEHSLDTALAAKADAIVAAVHIEDDGKPHLESPSAEISGMPRRGGDFYFQIWKSDGGTLAREAPVDALPHLSNHRKRFGNIQLPDGNWARATQISFYAQPDEDESDAAHPQPVSHQLTLVVAHDRRSIDQALDILLSGLIVTALAMTAGIVLVVTWSVRRGLRPLQNLAAQLERVEATTLDARFPHQGLPAEIQPVAQKLDDLMQRLRDAFARERRFSADVAHELRTPVAELRSSCEVALRWPENNALADTVAESLSIAKQMEETVNSLLALVRIQAAVEFPRKEDVDVAKLLASIWAELEPAATKKSLVVEQHFASAFVAQTDRRLFTQVLRNLLSNAVQHTPSAGRVVIESLCADQQITIRIRNTNDALESCDVPHLCEPFWRKDSARGDRSSTGLGLAIAKEYCDAIAASLEMELLPDRWFQVSITMRG